jgi:hypothetical protein
MIIKKSKNNMMEIETMKNKTERNMKRDKDE